MADEEGEGQGAAANGEDALLDVLRRMERANFPFRVGNPALVAGGRVAYTERFSAAFARILQGEGPALAPGDVLGGKRRSRANRVPRRHSALEWLQRGKAHR